MNLKGLRIRGVSPQDEKKSEQSQFFILKNLDRIFFLNNFLNFSVVYMFNNTYKSKFVFYYHNFVFTIHRDQNFENVKKGIFPGRPEKLPKTYTHVGRIACTDSLEETTPVQPVTLEMK